MILSSRNCKNTHDKSFVEVVGAAIWLGQTLTQQVVVVHVVVRRAPYHVPEVVPTLIPPGAALVLIAGVDRVLCLTHVAVLVHRTLVEDVPYGSGRKMQVFISLFVKQRRRIWLELYISLLGQMNKGTAFIDYDTRAEAEKAISYMDGGQLDGAVLSCAFVPRRQPSPPPPRRRGGRYNSPPPPPRRFAASSYRARGRSPLRRYSRSRSRSPIRRRRSYSYSDYSSSRSRSRSPYYSRSRSRSYSIRSRSRSRSRSKSRGRY
ncbi:4774_t:CDS:2 [Gigaspora margarita]|uniref:4774_t:CDS:1 n=1 Tax=Gigaspora margarita TaxID=4874 RepID=A0ABN7W2M1_GIGMA|nr:4774_t:CDS:2 [Gigaspora margarita]